jgi:hypothetical protein
MTNCAKPKQDADGKYVKNGAAAKTGLNKAILDSAWGSTVRHVKYNAIRKGKITVAVARYGSSQECSECHHTHPDNKKTQVYSLPIKNAGTPAMPISTPRVSLGVAGSICHWQGLCWGTKKRASTSRKKQ